MRVELHFCKLRMLRFLLCWCFPKIHGRNSELSALLIRMLFDSGFISPPNGTYIDLHP